MSDRKQLDRKKPMLIDFKQQGASEKLFPNPPLLTSYNCGWNDIYFEYHNQPSYETPEHQVTMHSISFSLCNTESERWFDGRFKSECIKKGSTAIIPAGTIHRCLWQQEAQFAIMAIDPMLIERLARELAAIDNIELIPHFATLQDPLIEGIAFALKDEVESGCMGDSLYVEQLTTTLAIHLLKKYGVKQHQISNYSDGLSSYKLRQVVEYIHAHLDSEIKLSALAELLDMSQYYFCRLFKQSMGVAPYQYVIEQRVERAKDLLREKKVAIAEIALQCGFANQSHFTKNFRKLTGTTPKAFRGL